MDQEKDDHDFFPSFDDDPIFIPIGNSHPSDSSESPKKMKAFNPQQALKQLPVDQQNVFSYLYLNDKKFPALMHHELFMADDLENNNEVEFMNEIKDTVFEPNWYQNAMNLEDFFSPSNFTEHEKDTYSKSLNKLKDNVDKIHNSTFNTIGINRTNSQAFYEHFQNFVYLKAETSFIHNFEQSWNIFIEEAKKIKGPGSDLITNIYNFWMNSFKKFTQEIWKYSEKYTLSFLKKNKDQSSLDSMSSDLNKSEKRKQTQKRRPWKNSQLQILEKVIESNGAYSQSTLNKIALELNRSSNSISSKIQKMIRNKKINRNPDFQQNDNMTLMDKIIEVLKIYPEGLEREKVIERINQHYEMGYDLTWTKSVAQILSSKPQFHRIKGTFGLVGQHVFDFSKKTFKDKVVNCLLKCPNSRGDLRKLVEVYIGLYGKAEGISILSQERIKTIQASISKSLCRYDIFDKSHSKTLYTLREFFSGQQMEIDIQSYIT